MGLDDTTILGEDSPTIHAFSIIQKPDTLLLNQPEEDVKKSSNLQASFTLFKVFVGSGILALPAAFANVGFGLGVISIILAGALTYYCMDLLLQVAQDLNSGSNLTLQGLADRVLGRWAKISVDISLVIMQAGIGIAILIFSTQFLNNVICSFNVNSMCNNHFFLACVALLVVVPLSFINNLHYFYIPSLMSIFFISLNVLVQLVINFDLITSQDSDTLLKTIGEFNFSNLPLFFGIATYSFEGVGVIFSVRSSMRKPQQFPRVLQIQMAIVAFLYSFFPATSELAFGKNVPDIILFSLPKDNYFYLVIQILYVISALLGYPVQIFPVIKILEDSLGLKKVSNEQEETRKEKYYRVGIRLGLVAVMLFVAMVAKSFNLFINLMGSGVFTYLGYLLPIAVYQMYFRGRVPKKNLVINVVAFVVGIVLGILGIIVSVQDIIEYHEN